MAEKDLSGSWCTFHPCIDEWYLLANRPLPEEERYDGYLQLENGVGMLRLLYEEVKAEVETMEMDASLHRVLSLATGRLAAPYIEKLGAMIREKLPNLTLQVYEIRNDFLENALQYPDLSPHGI